MSEDSAHGRASSVVAWSPHQRGGSKGFDPRACRAAIQSYLDGGRRVGPLGRVPSDEAHEEVREAGAIPDDLVWWAEEILLIERARELLLT